MSPSRDSLPSHRCDVDLYSTFTPELNLPQAIFPRHMLWSPTALPCRRYCTIHQDSRQVHRTASCRSIWIITTHPYVDRLGPSFRLQTTRRVLLAIDSMLQAHEVGSSQLTKQKSWPSLSMLRNLLSDPMGKPVSKSNPTFKEPAGPSDLPMTDVLLALGMTVEDSTEDRRLLKASCIL